jgi:hypothetical protein
MFRDHVITCGNSSMSHGHFIFWCHDKILFELSSAHLSIQFAFIANLFPIPRFVKNGAEKSQFVLEYLRPALTLEILQLNFKRKFELVKLEFDIPTSTRAISKMIRIGSSYAPLSLAYIFASTRAMISSHSPATHGPIITRAEARMLSAVTVTSSGGQRPQLPLP